MRLVSADAPPPDGTIERWAWDYVLGTDLARKLEPPRPPPDFLDGEPLVRRLARPGRPRELVLATEKSKTPRAGALKNPEQRARLLHRFFHHELQAAELMCWAILAFPSAPASFRRGVLGVMSDELRHMRMYVDHLERLGHPVGSFPVSDWFWERVPLAPTPAHFVAHMGIGLEGANLDHAPRFAAQLSSAGDTKAAAIQERIVEEEVPHVAFALHWFERLAGGPVDLDRWRAHLPPPLSPMILRGDPINLADRRRAGFPEPFLIELSRWTPESPGS